VLDFGANTVPGTTDMTAAFAAVALIGGRIYVPASGGPYLITDTVLFAVQRTTIIGDGQQRTIIKFAPTTTGKPCFHFKLASASTIAQGGVRGMAFDATGNTQGTKSAIRVTDGEEIILRDIAVSNWSSAGHDCIGVPFWSRQTHEFSDVTLFADIPISIETNPNISISIDHYHFFNCYLSATANPCIVIADGVNLTQVTFDGYQAWVGGTYGLFWNDTTTAQSSNGLTLKNVRTEQGTSVTAYAVSITHNTNMQGLVIDNCHFAPDRRGFFFRKVFSWHIKDSFYSDPAKEALNIDSSTSIGRSSNTFWQTGATATITGLTRIFQFGSGPNATLASDFCYMNTGSTNPALMAFLGTSGATNAGTGEVGEYVSQTIATGSSVNLGTGVTSNVAQITLSGGDWDVSGVIDFTFGATTSYTNLAGGISVTSATLGAQDSGFDYETPATVPTATKDQAWVVPTVRLSLAA